VATLSPERDLDEFDDREAGIVDSNSIEMLTV
jgi:hypothetical protein